MLTQPEGVGQDGGTSILYYAVDDIHHTHATLRARGVQFADEPHVIARMPDHDLWMTAFRDSEDNVLALMSEARRSRAVAAPPPGQTQRAHRFGGSG